jgi:hypothetical protein
MGIRRSILLKIIAFIYFNFGIEFKILRKKRYMYFLIDEKNYLKVRI